MSYVQHECGTRNARRRHQRRGETCTRCTPKPKELKPCGTQAAYTRHLYKGEKACDPCIKAHNAETSKSARNKRIRAKEGTQPTRNPSAETSDTLNELMFLLNAGEGEARILQALNTNPDALKRFLHRHHQNHLIPRIFTPWDLAA